MHKSHRQGCTLLEDRAASLLIALGRHLAEAAYHFVTPTPETVRRVRARWPMVADRSDASASASAALRNLFGWSLPCDLSILRGLLPGALLAEAMDCGILLGAPDGEYVATVRYSTLAQDIFVHSAYPTLADDSVFFGPDTYRFARLLDRELRNWGGSREVTIADIGCGSGAGGIHALRLLSRASIVLADVSPTALAFARINADLAGIEAEFRQSDVLAGIESSLDLVIANPPYLVDGLRRAYRHGGGTFGAELSLEIVRQSLQRLRPGGRLILYTGSAIVDGRDLLEDALRPMIGAYRHTYEEIDPDLFGEELEQGVYRRAERIAGIGLVLDV